MLERLPERAKASNSLPLDRLVFWFKCQWVYDNFRSHAQYDYKTLGSEYEAFGNYHYGIYTNVMGINATLAQAAAGAWQLKQGTSEWRNPEFIKNWFDDPADSRAIRKGQRYPIK